MIREDGRGNTYINGPGIIAPLGPDGPARQVADGIAFPNGMAVTPDNSTLIIAESHGKRLTAFDITADGSLSNRRVWDRQDHEGSRWRVRCMPMLGWALMFPMPRHSVAIRNKVLLPTPPSMQAKQPRSRLIVCSTSPPSRTRTQRLLGTSPYQTALSASMQDAVGDAVADVAPFLMAGRLKPGVTIEQAQQEMKVIAQRLAERFPDSNKGRTVSVEPLQLSCTAVH